MILDDICICKVKPSTTEKVVNAMDKTVKMENVSTFAASV